MTCQILDEKKSRNFKCLITDQKTKLISVITTKIMHGFDTISENVPFSVGIDTCDRLDKSVLPSINGGI